MLVTLRSTLYFAAMILSIVLFGLGIVTIGMLLPLTARDRMAAAWGSTNLWLMRVICGLKYRIHGKENLPKDAAIVMCKHQSTWETISLKSILPPAQSWILKQELMRIPVFGWALAAIPNIPIDRKAGRKAVKQIVERGSALLQQGRIIVIFPEGTRTAPGEKRKYGIGGSLLAEKSGYPVIPIAHNAGVFWRRRGLKKYPGTIDVVVGQAFDPAGMKASEITRKIEAWIETEVDKLPTQPE
ncbi:lysophospholipid acyltransferase family protein [Thiolapillus brandeum]|uniref:1-acyl-sn-glycerol-3-phosphate acyltransferase n=1 Tax=Thiolapillus brandeum TaxID=1076588 RepID=A0A7U6GG12_9GAMM|nr:lysophospholipid acyltransferase family protein [Thiolapillus brandeum]BAO42956.1 1-acyl-sn-glycerol-3-phosphate acyltransferase [Thiolapillus brandeum]